MQVSQLVQMPAMPEHNSSGSQKSNITAMLHSQGSSAMNGILSDCARVTESNAECSVNKLESSTRSGLIKGNSVNTPAAQARLAISGNSPLAGRPFGQTVNSFAKGNSGNLLSDGTSGMLVLAKGEEGKSMAIKQPLEKALERYNKSAAAAQQSAVNPHKPQVEEAPKPLDPRAMGGGDKVSELSADVEA